MKTPVLIFAALFAFVLCADEPQCFSATTNTLSGAETLVFNLVKCRECKERFVFQFNENEIGAARHGAKLRPNGAYTYATGTNQTEDVTIIVTPRKGIWDVREFRTKIPTK